MAWYVVHVGKEPGVYGTWAEAHAQVDGFKGNCYKKYNTRNEALQAFYGHLPENPPLLQPLNPPVLENGGHDDFPKCNVATKLVIVVVIAFVVGFLIWKMM
jgi:viroplasmin and RNaseH domain-containing protein